MLVHIALARYDQVDIAYTLVKPHEIEHCLHARTQLGTERQQRGAQAAGGTGTGHAEHRAERPCTLGHAQQPLGPSLDNCRIEQTTVADHPTVAPAQRLGVTRRQAFLPTKHRQCAPTPHERILDIRKHNDTSVIQSLKRWRQINARHLLKACKTGGDIAAPIIDHTRAQRLQHAGATVVGGTAAQTNIDSLCPSTDCAKHELAHAIGRSRQRRRLRTGRIPNPRRLGHLNNSRLAPAVNQ